MHPKYLALPLSLALVTVSSAQAYAACPPASPAAAGHTTTYVSGYTSYQKAPAGSSGGTGAALATVAVVGIVGYLVLKHEHDKQVAATQAACLAAQKPASLIPTATPPADPTAPMMIDGIVYTPAAKPAAVAAVDQPATATP